MATDSFSRNRVQGCFSVSGGIIGGKIAVSGFPCQPQLRVAPVGLLRRPVNRPEVMPLVCGIGRQDIRHPWRMNKARCGEPIVTTINCNKQLRVAQSSPMKGSQYPLALASTAMNFITDGGTADAWTNALDIAFSVASIFN